MEFCFDGSDGFCILASSVTYTCKLKMLLIVLSVFAILLSIAIIILAAFIFKNCRQKQKQETVKMTDSLTGIGNSEYFRHRFEHYISMLSRKFYYIAYIAIEIQRVEKYFGISDAEDLQRYAAHILSSYTDDMDFAVRISDGVFAIAFKRQNKEQAELFIEELLNKLNANEEKYRMPFRAGIFSLYKSNSDCETALYNARHGYNYAAKNKTKYCFCDDELLSGEALKSRLQRRLSEALKNEEFKLYFQFIVNAESGQICGAEVLSRWENPNEGLLTPNDYIQSMQSAGIIDRLDFYILEQCCRALEKWEKSGLNGFKISCNFTRLTISLSEFQKRFEDIIGRYKINRNNLIIELTEDSLADNRATAYSNILYCKNAGHPIALDDLGSGYTSFSDLCDYPIDIIKIDRHITAKAGTERGKALLKGICNLAKYLGMKIVCEGVENEYENKLVYELGCDFIQGYYYSQIYSLDKAEDFLKEKQFI